MERFFSRSQLTFHDDIIHEIRVRYPDFIRAIGMKKIADRLEEKGNGLTGGLHEGSPFVAEMRGHRQAQITGLWVEEEEGHTLPLLQVFTDEEKTALRLLQPAGEVKHRHIQLFHDLWRIRWKQKKTQHVLLLKG